MTAAALQVPRDRPSGVVLAEPPAERAARLALGLVLLVGELPSLGRREAQERRRTGRVELAELCALLGIVDAPMPPVGRTDVDRARWAGFAGEQDEQEDAAALACWAALGEPVEAWILTWRAALEDGRPVMGPKAQRMHEREEATPSERYIKPLSVSYSFGD